MGIPAREHAHGKVRIVGAESMSRSRHPGTDARDHADERHRAARSGLLLIGREPHGHRSPDGAEPRAPASDRSAIRVALRTRCRRGQAPLRPRRRKDCPHPPCSRGSCRREDAGAHAPRLRPATAGPCAPQPGRETPERIGAPDPATPSMQQRAIHARLPALHLEARMDQLASIGVVNAHRDLAVARTPHEPLVDGERADGRGHVAAVGAVVDAGPVHGDLGEGVVHVRIERGWAARSRKPWRAMRYRRPCRRAAAHADRGFPGRPGKSAPTPQCRRASPGDGTEVPSRCRRGRIRQEACAQTRSGGGGPGAREL